MKHLRNYFNDFDTNKLESIFDALYQDGWRVLEESFVDELETEWNFRDIDCFVDFDEDAFDIIMMSYKMFLEFKDKPITKDAEKIQEKLESANSKIKLLEEYNNDLIKELDARRKEYPTESPKASTKEHISLKRRKYVKIE